MTHASPQSGSRARVFGAVCFLLLTAGWATNHFASMLPVLRLDEHLSSVVVNGAFAIYALGLLPGLLGGGGLADRIGPRGIVLGGSVAAALGNLLMVFWHTELWIMVGRLIIGLGVGLVMSGGTAWAAQIHRLTGAAFAGIVLTLGFAIGPIASGLLAFFLPPGPRLTVPFVVSVVLSGLSLAWAWWVTSTRVGGAGDHPRTEVVSAGPSTAATTSATESGVGSEGGSDTSGTDHPRGIGIALLASLTMALWVFACATTSFIVVPSRLPVPDSFTTILPAIAAAIAFSAAIGIQLLAQRRRWNAYSGVVAAGLTGLGFLAIGLGGDDPSIGASVLIVLGLGTAYGLCMREGLTDVNHLAPPQRRGLVIGIFYVITYLGFSVPFTLEFVRPVLGTTLPLFVLAGLAGATAIVRAVHIATTNHFER